MGGGGFYSLSRVKGLLNPESAKYLESESVAGNLSQVQSILVRKAVENESKEYLRNANPLRDRNKRRELKMDVAGSINGVLDSDQAEFLSGLSEKLGTATECCDLSNLVPEIVRRDDTLRTS